MRRLIIDRFEGSFAVCEQEDKSFTDVPKYKVPPEAKEGDCLIEKDGIYTVDYKRIDEKKKLINERFSKLFSK